MCKKEYFTKTNIQRKIFNMVQNNYNTTISMIQQYDIHAGQGLEIGPETTDATKGIKLSRRKKSLRRKPFTGKLNLSPSKSFR